MIVFERVSIQIWYAHQNLGNQGGTMRHIKQISTGRPAPAQFESVIQLVGLLQSLLQFYTNVANTFWIEIPHKAPEPPEN